MGASTQPLEIAQVKPNYLPPVPPVGFNLQSKIHCVVPLVGGSWAMATSEASKGSTQGRAQRVPVRTLRLRGCPCSEGLPLPELLRGRQSRALRDGGPEAAILHHLLLIFRHLGDAVVTVDRAALEVQRGSRRKLHRGAPPGSQRGPPQTPAKRSSPRRILSRIVGSSIISDRSSRSLRVPMSSIPVQDHRAPGVEDTKRERELSNPLAHPRQP